MHQHNSFSMKKTNLDTGVPRNWIPAPDEPLYVPKRIRMICVGAGFSGLMLAYKHKYEFALRGAVHLVIYEKNHDVGGTWLENRYPGVACDIPAHVYTFPFEPNPDWSSFYADGAEIWEYIKRTSVKYGLEERVQLESKVIESVWDGSVARWKVKIERGGEVFTDEAEILVNSSGILNKWRWPDIKGLYDFRGKIAHSASWDTSLDWTGKRVALIGNGSSAIQILPKVQRTAKNVVNYIRSPTWVAANFAANFTPEGKNFRYSEEQKKAFRENPQELLKLRRDIEHGINQLFLSLIKGTDRQLEANNMSKRIMEERLNHDPELCAKLIPTFEFGCRRISPGEGYLEALQESNVSCCFDPIQRVTQDGIQTADGQIVEYDIIICATGFDVSFSPFWKLTGRNGINLAELWEKTPNAYFGICAPQQPNYFIFNGPNCPIAHGSLLAAMDSTADWILKWCQKIVSEGIKSVCVKQDALDDYNVYTQEALKRTVWTGGCRSWFKAGKRDGPVTAMYAGSIIHYKEILESFRVEDFDFEYDSANRFRFMGNGTTQREVQMEDLAYYVK
ncbi:putative flavin-binding monooxygenase [Penicillium brasilianum]|uniref:Putative flavin-binding monooxygenase n=1 Tax=Penicillium brasilianum TaxID=104259 RepID=A0A1S9S0R9_PENBI|nr:putative flavin-binding monooxygenase [Penicillium brasilianum]